MKPDNPDAGHMVLEEAGSLSIGELVRIYGGEDNEPGGGLLRITAIYGRHVAFEVAARTEGGQP